MVDVVERNRERIVELCQRYGVRRLDLFGSAAREVDFDSASSDVDFLYEFDLDARGSLVDRFFGLLEDLEATVDRPVDLVSAADIVNPCFLAVANRHRITLYAA